MLVQLEEGSAGCSASSHEAALHSQSHSAHELPPAGQSPAMAEQAQHVCWLLPSPSRARDILEPHRAKPAPAL